MDTGWDTMRGSELLAMLDAVVDALTDDRLRLEPDADQLALLAAALQVEGRLHTFTARLAAHLEATDAAWREHSTSTTTWLTGAATLTRNEASRLLAHGQQLHRFGLVEQAAAAGAVLPTQADAITSVLDALPAEFPTQTVQHAQELMIGFAATHNSAELRRLSRHLLEVAAPDVCDQLEADRLDREHRHAQRNRHLTFTPDHHGSVLIKGSLPVCDAEPLIRIVDAYTAHQHRGDDTTDPHAELLTPAMRRADGLLALIHHHTHQALAPGHGGDRPRIVVTLDYDTLDKAARHAGPLRGRLVSTGDPVPAGVLGQWLCDADLMPAVLGGPCEILDVGRSQRLVTPAIRAALELRDKGCAFPGCNAPPSACQAHHLIPPWAGGPTALWNLVLLCPHHHGTVDPHQQPRRHTRYHTPRRE